MIRDCIYLVGVSYAQAIKSAIAVKEILHSENSDAVVELVFNGTSLPITTKRPMTVEEAKEFVTANGIQTIDGRPGAMVSRFKGSQQYCGAVFTSCINNEDFVIEREVAYRAANGDYLTPWTSLEVEE